MLLLACDFGNTRFKYALYNNEELIDFRISSYDKLEAGLFKDYELSSIAISSVVPSASETAIRLFRETYGIEPFVITHKSSFNLKINYLTPETLGIDRLCSCEGAWDIFRQSPAYIDYNEKIWLITIDSGTATTVNIVKYKTEFSGGIIMPGITTMIRSLSGNTAQLPEISTDDYTGLIGNDTKSSIASGIINSTAGMIEKVCSYLEEDLNADGIIIYLTGGNAGTLSRHIKRDNMIIVKDLVLRGVKAVYEKNRG